jgi:hypothetical protein
MSSAAGAALIALASFGVLGCEDGPAQTFAPVSSGTGSMWNNTGGSSTDPSTKDFGYLHGGTNANILCDGPKLAKTWANMDVQPILPPLGGAGINMAGADCASSGTGACSWAGLTIEQAEKQLCQSTNLGDLFGDGELANSWGDSEEVIAHYRVSTHKIDFMLFITGYLGTIQTTGCSGTVSNGNTYSFPVGVQMTRNNQNWTIDWNAAKGPTDWRNEVTSALLCTFAPGLAVDPDCNSSGRCIQGSFGDVAYLYIPVLGTGLWVPNMNAAQPQPSILNRIDGYLAKVTPFAGAAPFLKLDAEGPTASSGVINKQLGKPCELKFGLNYSDFLDECVKITGDPKKDDAEYNKLLGGLTHGAERYSFDVQGVDLNFVDSSLAPDAVITDTDRPGPNDMSVEFSVDQSTLGPIVEDFTHNDPTQPKDLHGAGLVYLQFARLAQRDFNAAMQSTANGPAFAHTIGDPACAGGAFASSAPVTPPLGCTGLEDIITPTPRALVDGTQPPLLGTTPPLDVHEAAMLANAGLPTAVPDITATSNVPPILVQMRLGLKPGHQKTAFCDADRTNLQQLLDCDQKWLGDTFSNTFARTLSVLGGGKVANMPLDARDVRFFFKEWVKAIIQYMKAEGAAVSAQKDPSLITLADVDAQTIDRYNLFFDSIGAGQYETAEYVERAWATNTTPPLDFSFSADVKNGILNDYAFSRYLYRGENALYQAIRDERGGAVALASQDNALLSNIFGSPVLRAGWKDHTSETDTTHTAYYCATHLDPVPCKGDQPPLLPAGQTNPDGTTLVEDEAGEPLLTHYEGAFGSSSTPFTLGGGANPSNPVPISFVKTGPNGDGTYPDIQQAMVNIPLHVNPYDLTSAPPSGSPPAVQALVPWAPKQPGIGFPVALDGQRDRFIETYQLDFTGSQITANVDYDFQIQQNGTPSNHIMFMAVETTDFLGDIFVCRDMATKDLLAVRMYTSVELILDWFAAHPTAYNDCQVIIRYSPYENYADYITSLLNGVRLGVTQGGGYGRIVDGTLFDPTLPGH